LSKLKKYRSNLQETLIQHPSPPEQHGQKKVLFDSKTISKLAYIVTPAQAGVQNMPKSLNSRFRGNDVWHVISKLKVPGLF